MFEKLWDFEKDGTRVREYLLRTDGARQEWLGNVVLESTGRRGRLFSITDYGNYSFEWYDIGMRSFAQFLLDADAVYIAGKLGMGHDEARVFNAEGTSDSLKDTFEEMKGDEDADWIGEMLTGLEDCETEQDFIDWGNEAGLEDAPELLEYTPGRQLRGYRARVIPALKEAMRQEVKEEEKHTDLPAETIRAEEIHAGDIAAEATYSDRIIADGTRADALLPSKGIENTLDGIRKCVREVMSAETAQTCQDMLSAIGQTLTSMERLGGELRRQKTEMLETLNFIGKENHNG